MGGETLDRLGDLQRAALEAVWALGEANVQQVRDRLAQENRGGLAYTTVLTALQKLEKAGWLTHRTEGRAYIYIPTQSRDEAGVSTVRALTRRVFGGDSVRLFQHLIADEQLTDQDLAQLRRMIDRQRTGKEPRDG